MKKKIILLAVLLLAAALIFWFFYPLRSYVVMSVYSGQHSNESVLKKNGFSLDIPSGEGWYPFVMTYNADGFDSWSGIDADMSILYNFGAFDTATRTSSFYDVDSDKYCAFYGAYVLHQNDGVFGFTDGEVDMDAITQAVKYDYTQLVLAGFGCDDIVFDVDEFDIQPDMSYAGRDGWTRIDAAITTNGVAHQFIESKTAYLQYGPPTKPVDEDFSVTTLQGRLYIKYIEDYDCTVMLYVIAPNANAVETCDDDVLSKAVIVPLEQ
jgi:hypothetical protein